MATEHKPEEYAYGPASPDCCVARAERPAPAGGHCPRCMAMIQEYRAGGSPPCVYCGRNPLDGMDMGCSPCRAAASAEMEEPLPRVEIGRQRRSTASPRVIGVGDTVRIPGGSVGRVAAVGRHGRYADVEIGTDPVLPHLPARTVHIQCALLEPVPDAEDLAALIDGHGDTARTLDDLSDDGMGLLSEALTITRELEEEDGGD